MTFIFMMMVAGLLIRVIAILGAQTAAKIDRYLAHEKVGEAAVLKMKVVHGRHIIKESLLKAQA